MRNHGFSKRNSGNNMSISEKKHNKMKLLFGIKNLILMRPLPRKKKLALEIKLFKGNKGS